MKYNVTLDEIIKLETGCKYILKINETLSPQELASIQNTLHSWWDSQNRF